MTRRRRRASEHALPRAPSLAFALALVLPASLAAQPELVEITVREGDTCRSIAARVYGDADAYSLLHRHNPELGPMPHRLVPGTVLRVPPPEAAARVALVHRRVERRPPDAAAFAEARAGHPLPRGSQLRTHDGASATIRFADREEVQVRERTLVIVWGGERRLTQRPVTRAELESGALRSRLDELAGRRPLEVETPSARASLDGEAVVSVEPDGSSRVANHGRRAATVEAGGARVTLPPGTGAVVARGERPSAPRRLLPAPRWRADRTGPVVGFVGRGATLSGGFEPVAGAARYRVEVARRPDGDDLVVALEVDGGEARFEAPGLPEGTVYVSVASVAADGLEGRRSPWRAFGVRLARLVEPGGAAARIDADVPQVWPGTWLVAPRSMECALDGEPPSGIVTLRRSGQQTLTCADGAGGAALLTVEVAPVALRTPAGGLARDRVTPVRVHVVAPRPPPARHLVARVGDGFRIEATRADGDALVVDVWASPDAPAEASLAIAVAAGSEHVPLGALALPVLDPAGTAAASAPPEVAPPRPRPAQGLFGELGWPTVLGLRDERRGGLAASLWAAVAEAPGDPQVRLGVSARATLPETPVRLGFASQLDVLAPGGLGADRRGSADLWASAGVLAVDAGELGLALELGAWFPTRAEPESLGRVRLAPSLEGSWRPLTELALRTRQGALLDATGDGARLWAWAVGVDVAPLSWLAIGAELDAAVGVFADGAAGAALSLGGALEGRFGLVDVALGARFALTDEARALLGAWSLGASFRLASE
ncbi:MAG: FecR domain-containing protein [Sandaracinaceae bacterium]|nr:FecR domain-containing protein [Sandaracinaceae bacterium]